MKFHSVLCCQLKAVRNPVIIHGQSQEPGNQRAICPMPASCCKKRAMQPDFRFLHLFSKELPAHVPDPHRSCSM